MSTESSPEQNDDKNKEVKSFLQWNGEERAAFDWIINNGMVEKINTDTFPWLSELSDEDILVFRLKAMINRRAQWLDIKNGINRSNIGLINPRADQDLISLCEQRIEGLGEQIKSLVTNLDSHK